MAFKIAAGIALSIIFGGVAVLILWTIVVCWKKMMERIQKRLDDNAGDYYTEDDFDWSEIEQEIEKDAVAAEEKDIKDWFENNDIELWEDK